MVLVGRQAGGEEMAGVPEDRSLRTRLRVLNRPPVPLPVVECTDATLDDALGRCMQVLVADGAVCLRGASDWQGALERVRDTITKRGVNATPVNRIANVTEKGVPVGAMVTPHLQSNSEWHHDGTYLWVDIRYSMLAAECVHDTSTELLRVDAKPRRLASAFKRVRVVHVHRAFQSKEDAREVEHPLFRLDPDSQRLDWCLGAHAQSIRKLPEPVSSAIVRVLGRAVIASGRHYRHHWQPNDVMMWNNIRYMHRGTQNMPGDAPRVVHRVGFVEPTAASS
jgi:hypothetical protein